MGQEVAVSLAVCTRGSYDHACHKRAPGRHVRWRERAGRGVEDPGAQGDRSPAAASLPALGTDGGEDR